MTWEKLLYFPKSVSHIFILQGCHGNGSRVHRTFHRDRLSLLLNKTVCLPRDEQLPYQFTISLLDTYYVPLPLHGDQDSFWSLDHMRVISVQSRQREVYYDALPCRNLGFCSTHCLLKLSCLEQTKIFEGQRHCLLLWQPWVGADMWESSWISEAQSSWWLTSRGCSLL